MQERVLEELKALGNRVSMNEEQIVAKYNEIAKQNNIDMEQPRSDMIAITLTRNFIRGALSDKLSMFWFLSRCRTSERCARMATT